MDKKTQSLIENSGMITHLKVINYLRAKGWTVVISPYYYDGIADSVREIDIVAERQFNSAGLANHSSVQINVQLFIECKYIKQEILLWFDQTDKDKAVEAMEKATGLRLAVRQSGDIVPASFHYYQAQRVAKLFSTNSGKEDLIYKALSQSLRALVYYKQWAPGPIRHNFNGSRETISHIVKYPVIVCDNFANLKELVVDTNTGTFSVKKLESPFLLETNYVYFNKFKTTTIDDYFWIDFLDADHLEPFLKILKSEAEAILDAKAFIQNIQRNRN